MTDNPTAGGDPTVVALGLVLNSLIEMLVEDGALSRTKAEALFERALNQADAMPDGFFQPAEMARLQAAVQALRQFAIPK